MREQNTSPSSQETRAGGDSLRIMATPVGTGPVVQDVAPKGGFPKVREQVYCCDLLSSLSAVCRQIAILITPAAAVASLSYFGVIADRACGALLLRMLL